ncbi:hypothetical protein BHE74_00016247 [Ensete ventricosum]|nr:hypothetical protein BHE74_00016247 [Ensete ventricosum]
MVSQNNVTVIKFRKVPREVEFELVFRAPYPKFKILAIPNVLAHGKSYKHDFSKKRDGHKLSQCCARSRVRSVFCAPSQKFKILAIPNVLAYGNSYEHCLMKKCDGYKLCAKSCAKSSFVLRLKNSKYWSFLIILVIPNVLAHGNQ